MPQRRSLLTNACAALVAAAGLCSLDMIGATSNALAADNPAVVLDTSEGPVTIELYADKAPVTVENFLKYVDEGYYNNTIFHRVIPGFMIQGGGFTNENPPKEKPTREPIKNESRNGLGNKKGTIAMARTSNPNSATSQFFINHKDNAALDFNNPGSGGGYTVFGAVTEGMDVVDKIAKSPTGQAEVMASGPQKGILQRAPFDDVPLKPIVIKSAKRKAKG
jgi:peptidyl-prolyl cis-trans isomerase A (cyclophilin A)